MAYSALFAALAASPPAPVMLAVDPINMADITLTGEWGLQQSRNQEVLMSINLTSWACHFTTTANLTACRAAGSLWHTYFKESNGSFLHKTGFLTKGDDVKPATTVPFSTCEAFCAGSSVCEGFTFQADDAKPAGAVHCYWKTSTAHFTPQSLRANCLTPGNPSAPACAPLPGEMGLGGYYGHYQGHWLSATSFLINSTKNATVKAQADAAIDALEAVMAAWAAKYGADGYLFPYDPIVWDKLLAGHGARPWFSVPFYTLHKLMAGLLDQYVFAGSKKAYTMVSKMAQWVHQNVEKTIATGGEKLWQTVLLTEWGGMNDVLLELYRHSADPTHYATARRFNGYVFSARLADGVDDLSLLPFPHANFHLPEIVGNARAFELSGNATDRAIVETFFDVLTANHSYCTGGSNSGECWQAPRDLGNFLSTQTEESCTQYNVLKVARHLFRWHAESRYADFYERAILNGIVGNQKAGRSTCGSPASCKQGDAQCRSPGERASVSQSTSYIYMLPLGGVVTKPWGKSDYGFPCCWGTLSESFAKLSDSLFFSATDASAFYVNLYESATAEWAARPGVSIEQKGSFPLGTPTDPATVTTLVAHVAERARGAPATFALRVRVPAWLAGKGTATLNGKPFTDVPIVAGSYFSLSREWHDADTLTLAFPAALWTAPLNDKHAWHNATVAFMYGPLVLAGVDVASDIFVPPAGGVADPSTFIKRNASVAGRLEFVATARDGSSMRMIPLRDVMDERYVAYFYTAGTKPPQPRVVYCPHSHDDDAIEGKGTSMVEDGAAAGAAQADGAGHIGGGHQHVHDDGHGHGEDEEAALFSDGAPPPAPPPLGRGVQWEVSPAGQMMSLQM